ncbi:MAG: sigma-54-dependent Fis family transcriptional regulator [Deltaproteobacteria bacterium]|nr:MAG: sigma-54-dependent Fis family transcriptional regulator [Deltaproteobacteria bacterium]
MNASILVVDDEQNFLDSVKRMLRLEGYDNVHTFSKPLEALAEVQERQEPFDLAFLDITMPQMNGLDLLEHIKTISPQTECLMVTAHDSAPLVVKALRRGAYDYLVKPVTPQTMMHTLGRALERKMLLASLHIRSKEALDHPEAFQDILTASSSMLRILHEAELHARSEIPVLVTGETGVGKELLAQAIHKASQRKEGPFVAVNLLSITPSLFESTLFGYRKGSFTGAEQDRPGTLAQAAGGTLFLDEIGDLPWELQGKLLRVLQEGEYTPVGDTKPRQTDVRIIAATHQDLALRVKQRKFRKDLLYRLQFAHLQLPPLRERPDDILPLAHHILQNSHRPDVELSVAAKPMLRSYGWPGNVRELKGTLEAAANLAEDGVITPSHLRLPASPPATTVTVQTPATTELVALADVERQHILHVYEALSHNKTQTAKTLGIGLQTLHRKLKAYGVS